MKLKMKWEGLPLCDRCKGGLILQRGTEIYMCKNCHATYEEIPDDSISPEQDELMSETEKDMKDLELRKNREKRK